MANIQAVYYGIEHKPEMAFWQCKNNDLNPNAEVSIVTVMSSSKAKYRLL
jgi:hypothetical protein